MFIFIYPEQSAEETGTSKASPEQKLLKQHCTHWARETNSVRAGATFTGLLSSSLESV